MTALPAEDLGWVPESRALILLDLPRSTLQSWVRERLAELPERGAFRVRDLFAFLLVSTLRTEFPLSEARALWRGLQRDHRVDEFVQRASRVENREDRLEVVIDPVAGDIAFCTNDDELASAISRGVGPRTLRVLPMTERILRVRSGFDNFALREPIPEVRRGRPRRSSTLTQIRSEQ